MLQNAIRTIGWIAVGVVQLCVVLYLAALAVNWNERGPSAAAVRFTEMYRDRPAVADEDNAFLYLRSWKLDPDRRTRRSARVEDFSTKCKLDEKRCVVPFDATDGLLEEWQAVEPTLLDQYLAFIAHTGWREASSFSLSEPPPSGYPGAWDGQKLLLLRARKLAQQGDAASVRALLERDLQFWRTVLRSSGSLRSRMMAVAMLERHFEWGYLVLRKLPPRQLDAAIPEGWRSGISDAERSMLPCIVGEWMFTSKILRDLYAARRAAAKDLNPVDRMLETLEQPLLKVQDAINQSADLYWEVAQIFDVPLERYAEAIRRADEVTQRRKDEAAELSLDNMLGFQTLSGLGSFTDYAAQGADIEGVRRAALLAATLRAAGIEAEGLPAAVANAELRDPYTDRPFDWDAIDSAIVFRGLGPGAHGRHRLYY
jgi:hypothetical protein